MDIPTLEGVGVLPALAVLELVRVGVARLLLGRLRDLRVEEHPVAETPADLASARFLFGIPNLQNSGMGIILTCTSQRALELRAGGSLFNGLQALAAPCRWCP